MLLGLVLVPVVLAKLWSVVPKLVTWPPARSLTDLLERGTVPLLVGSVLFEIVTGVLNIQYDYVIGFSFYAADYGGAWVIIGAFVAHTVLKVPRMVAGLRRRADPPDHDLVADDPLPPTISRRSALALVGGALVGVLSVGQVLDGPLRGTALLLPRRRTTAVPGGGPNDFPVKGADGPVGPGPAGPAAAHRGPVDRLRRGLVHAADADRGAAARPRPARRGARAGLRAGPLAGGGAVRTGRAAHRAGGAP